MTILNGGGNAKIQERWEREISETKWKKENWKTNSLLGENRIKQE